MYLSNKEIIPVQDLDQADVMNILKVSNQGIPSVGLLITFLYRQVALIQHRLDQPWLLFSQIASPIRKLLGMLIHNVMKWGPTHFGVLLSRLSSCCFGRKHCSIETFLVQLPMITMLADRKCRQFPTIPDTACREKGSKLQLFPNQ